MTEPPARIEGLTQAQHDAVEALFAQDLPGGDLASLHPRVAKALVSEGLAEVRNVTLPGRPPVTVKAHRLTLTGHFLYCEWAATQPLPEGFEP